MSRVISALIYFLIGHKQKDLLGQIDSKSVERPGILLNKYWFSFCMDESLTQSVICKAAIQCRETLKELHCSRDWTDLLIVIYIFILLIVIKNKSCVNVTSFWINNSSCHESDPEDPTYGRLWPRKGKSVIDASRYAAYCANNMEVYPLTHLYMYGCNLDRSPN